MPALEQPTPKVVNAVLGQKPEFIRIFDWKGNPLVFILADEIPLEEEGFRMAEKDRYFPS